MRIDRSILRMTEPPRRFYLGDTAEVARRLLGCWLLRKHEGEWYGCRIVETEAYLGVGDAAAHSRGGRRTPRVEPMYREGGHLYVFLVYGMHHCANVVTRPAGVPEAVLLRAAEGPPGTPERLLSGPGRLCAAMGIGLESSGKDLLERESLSLRCPDRPSVRIGAGLRIGVDYAGEAKDWPLRFADLDSQAVSGPGRLRRDFREVRPNAKARISWY